MGRVFGGALSSRLKRALTFIALSTAVLVSPGCLLVLKTNELAPGATTQQTSTTLPSGDLYVTASSTIAAGQCSPVLLELKTAGGALVPAPTATSFTLAATGTVQFYTTAGCGITTASIAFVQAQSSATVYARTTTSGVSTLTFTDAGAVYTTRNHNLTIDPDAASQLAFLSQPANSVAGDVVNSNLQVEIKDTYGNRVTAGTPSVAMSIQTNPGTSTLGGTVSVSAASGIATFTTLWLNKVGTGYVLRATLSAITADSSTFDISPAAPTKLGFTVQHASNYNLTAGATLPTLQVAIQDTYGNTVPTASDTIRLYPITGSGDELPQSGTFDGTTTTTVIPGNPVTTTAGLASFPNITMTRAIETWMRAVSSSGYTTGNGNVFFVNATATATKLKISGGPAVIPGLCTGAITVNSADTYGNPRGVASPRTINLTGAGAGTFYSDATCTTSTTSLSFAGGANAGTFYYKTAATSGSLTFTATDTDGSPLTAATFALEITKFSQIGVGGLMTCALTNSGAVYCWGQSYTGRLNGNVNTIQPRPLVVHGLESGVTQISVGQRHACAIKSGAASCFGYNPNGQVGVGPNVYGGRLWATEVVGLSSGVTRVTAGANSSCAIQSGALYCWGRGFAGTNGNGLFTDQFSPVAVPGFGSGVTDVDSTSYTTCAVQSGAAYCWGQQSSGGVGAGAGGGYTATPTAVTGLSSGVASIRVSDGGNGGGVGCAVLSSGALKCWGENRYGQVGDGSATVRTTPVDVTGMGTGVTEVAPGQTHSCAMKSGAVYCWGIGIYGELGNGTLTTSYTPVAVTWGSAPGTLTSLAVGRTQAASCILNDGMPTCWGSSLQDYYFGASTVSLVMKSSATLSSLSNVTSLASLSSGGKCATVNGAVQCWGANGSVLGGYNVLAASLEPVTMTGMSTGFTEALAGGWYHFCALKAGQVFCRGSGAYGTIGNGSFSNVDFNATPTAVTGLSSVTAIASSFWHVCAIDSGAVYCWGRNAIGQLGNGDLLDKAAPVAVPGLGSGVTSIAASSGHSSGAGSANGLTCVAHSGAAKCWGHNIFGTIGDGTTVARTAPTQVTGLTSGVTQVVTGFVHACALQSGGVKCWGDNSSGQLGDGTWTSSLIPVQVSGLTSGVASIATSGSTTCAVMTAGGGVKCWGWNQYGVLGNGTTSNANVPTDVAGLTAITGMLNNSGYTQSWMGFLKSGQFYGTGSDYFGDTTKATIAIQPAVWDQSF